MTSITKDIIRHKLVRPLIASLSKHELFPEIVVPLFYSIERLYGELERRNVAQVFFLSREGKPLKSLFDLYQARVNGTIKSRYLEVSRRSTMLPSLAPLQFENFETLFRQYRQISLFEFLASLGLEDASHIICDQLGLDDNSCQERLDDFPASNLFARLRNLLLFQRLYEAERSKRREAFISYLSSIADGKLPEDLVVVDVGWKGTIQDNLFALLCRNGSSPVRSLTGFYVGLVAEGDAGPGNTKHGLLFSSVDGQSPHFSVFNENRALFEILLAADHGSAVRYEKDSNGTGRVVRGKFEEEEMLREQVFPVQRRLFKRFEDIVDTAAISGQSLSLTTVAQSYARIVFQPTSEELKWFDTVFHVENFGVFERSYFVDSSVSSSWWDRLVFLFRLLKRRERGKLGFWPWKTLKERCGISVARVYGFVRYRWH